MPAPKERLTNQEPFDQLSVTLHSLVGHSEPLSEIPTTNLLILSNSPNYSHSL